MKRIKVIEEGTLKSYTFMTGATTLEELLRELKKSGKNVVVVRNGRVVYDLGKGFEDGDEIRIMEAVGGG